MQLLLWSVVYLLVITANICTKQQKGGETQYKPAMPYIPGAISLAWEINALFISFPFWGHIVWVILDIIIFVQNYQGLQDRKRKIAYLFLTVGLIVCLYFVFRHKNGMLVSAFADDLINAIVFLIAVRRITPLLKTEIAVARLLGDVFAWLCYRNVLSVVDKVGIIVLVLNLLYLILLEIDLRRRVRKQ